MSTVNEYHVAPGEHIASIKLIVGECTKVIFDEKYYYYYIQHIGGSLMYLYINVKDVPKIKENSYLPDDGTLRSIPGKDYWNTMHEEYSECLYLYQPEYLGISNDGAEFTIIATNNKNVNF